MLLWGTCIWTGNGRCKPRHIKRELPTHALFCKSHLRSLFQVGHFYLIHLQSLKFVIILVQYSECIWDSNTNEMKWYPDHVLPCDRKYLTLCIKILENLMTSFYRFSLQYLCHGSCANWSTLYFEVSMSSRFYWYRHRVSLLRPKCECCWMSLK